MLVLWDAPTSLSFHVHSSNYQLTLPSHSSTLPLTEDETDALFRSNARLTSRPARLPASLLQVTRLKDANISEPSQAVVQTVRFHPAGRLLMTAGLDKSLRFFEVSMGAQNMNAVSCTCVVIHRTENRSV